MVAKAVDALELLAREQDTHAERCKAAAHEDRQRAAKAEQDETMHRQAADAYREAARRLQRPPAATAPVVPEPAPAAVVAAEAAADEPAAPKTAKAKR